MNRGRDGPVEGLEGADEGAVVGHAEAPHDRVGPVAEHPGREPHSEGGGQQGEDLPGSPAHRGHAGFVWSVGFQTPVAAVTRA
jgi:hypothetical protein